MKAWDLLGEALLGLIDTSGRRGDDGMVVHGGRVLDYDGNEDEGRRGSNQVAKCLPLFDLVRVGSRQCSSMMVMVKGRRRRRRWSSRGLRPALLETKMAGSSPAVKACSGLGEKFVWKGRGSGKKKPPGCRRSPHVRE